MPHQLINATLSRNKVPTYPVVDVIEVRKGQYPG